ncbi:MAG: hypothetical protein R3181_09935 [Rubricoccaceae bacterium]|nr:hypothetical protein [Rubricoccaceae bacterium]
MRSAVLLLALLAAPLAAQPPPTGVGTPEGHSLGETHFFAELFGAGAVFSFNVDREVLPRTVVRGGIGYAPWVSGGFPLSGVGGVSVVPFGGTFRPEVGASAAAMVGDRVEVLPGAFLGLRIQTSDRSLLRLGTTLFLFPDGFGTVVPWPSFGFGGRL